MIIPNNIPTELCRDARSLRPLIINKLASFYFGHTSRVSLHFRTLSSLGVFIRLQGINILRDFRPFTSI